MKINLDIDNTTLDVLATKLKKVVSPLDILKWLNNFEKSEVSHVINILFNLTVYTTSEIEEVLNNSFYKLFPVIDKDERVVVCPIGEFGKSGSMVSYFFQKTSFYKGNMKKITLLSSLNNINIVEGNTYKLILIDDFIGTGGSVEEFYNKEVLIHKDKFTHRYFIGIAGMDFGIDRIKKCFDKILIPKSNIFRKAFSGQARFFGYRNHSKYRELAYKYGSKIAKPQKSKSGKPNALGFENSQALVSFAYGTPNNTLSIIWANSEGWFPLIPRFSVDRISQAKEVRKNISHELSILKELGSSEIINTFFNYRVVKGKRIFSSVNKLDFSLYSIIKLLRKGYTTVSICQVLGIFDSDFEQLIKKGVERQLFNTDHSLTDFGLRIYYDAKKCIDRKRTAAKYDGRDYYKIKEVNYLPKRFNGKS
jgi:hypothetical protein